MNEMFSRMNHISRIVVSAFIGSALLSVLSFIQKVVVGFDPFLLRGYLVSFIFGGAAGAIVGMHISRVFELNEQLRQRVNTLEKFLPICAQCKRIRKPDSDSEKQSSWEPVEKYITDRTSSNFSHGYCPECAKKILDDIS